MSDFVPTSFYLFAWDPYEAVGGWGDFKNSYPTQEKAKAAAIERKWRCWQIVWGEVIVEEN
jgi:hypothetical protein